MSRYYLYVIKLFVIMLLLNSCSTSNDPSDLIIRFSSVAEIINIDSSSPIVTFRIKAWWGNSCGRFHHADIVESDQSYNIKVFGFQNKEDICLTVTTKYEATITIDVQKPGEYTFRFLESDSATIDTTIKI